MTQSEKIKAIKFQIQEIREMLWMQTIALNGLESMLESIEIDDDSKLLSK